MRIVQMIALALIVATGALAQQPPRSNVPEPTALWTLSADVNAPESAYYDATSNAIFVSSINGDVLAKDGNGYISRLAADGKVVNAKWATGLNAPKGLRSVGGTLWVTDIDEVVAIEIASGRISSHVKIDGAKFLNDLATAADGTVYASDSQTFRIYAVKDGKASMFVEIAEPIETPNGVLVDGNRLIVGTMGAPGARGAQGAPGAQNPPSGGRLIAFDLRTKAKTEITPQPIGGIDGIESDGRGGFLVTDVFGMRLLHVSASGAARTLLQFTAAGADFGYIASRQIAVVPFLFGNSVAAYDLSGVLK
jgi:outer membrane protein assembly factor BamB